MPHQPTPALASPAAQPFGRRGFTDPVLLDQYPKASGVVVVFSVRPVV